MLSRFIPHWWIQLLLIVFFGTIIQLFINIIFNLVYIDYPVVSNWASYLFGIGFTFFASYAVHIQNSYIRRIYTWSSYSIQFGVQAFVNIVSVLLLLLSSRYILFNYIFTDNFNSLLDELIIATVAFFTVTLYLMLELGFYLLDKWRKSLADLERFKKERAEFQFEMLRMQVNPHFLFNSLNTLSSLIFHDPDKASVFIRKLSYVYRYVLETRKTIMLTLEEEMEFVNSYVYLLELRLHEKLIFVIEIAPHHMRQYIAPMTLQILIENAVKHNVASSKKILKIHIYTDKEGYLVVQNILQPKRTTRFSSGIGLENIKSRYQFIVNKQVDVILSERHFTVKVPLIEHYEDSNN